MAGSICIEAERTSILVTAQVGGTLKRQAKASGRKPFFFEKKNQKTFAKPG
jgi:hypothetical protein